VTNFTTTSTETNALKKTRIFALSALNQRRLRTFKAHKRAYYSLWILFSLMCLSFTAPFIAHDAPYVVYVSGKIYTPFVKHYPETVFGGSLPIETDFKNREIQAFIKKRKGWMLWPPIVYGPHSVNEHRKAPAPPSKENWLGTDDQGRDVLARLLFSWRTSLAFGFLLAAASLCLGLFIGSVQGYFGGLIDLFGQRFHEIWSSLPILFLLIILSSFVKPTFSWLLGLMLLFSWMGLSSIVRAEFLRARNYDYVKAARIMGGSSFWIIRKHLLPNAMVATLAYLPFLINHSITVLTSLDFLGFGLPLGTPSMGELLTQAKNNLYAPWLIGVAFFGIGVILILVTFIGEGVRDALDAYAREHTKKS